MWDLSHHIERLLDEKTGVIAWKADQEAGLPAFFAGHGIDPGITCGEGVAVDADR